MTSKHVVYGWLISVILVPAVFIFHWGFTYIFYVAILAVGSYVLLSRGPQRKDIPILLIIQLGTLFLLSAVYLTDYPTLLNILALIFFNLMMIVLLLNVPNKFWSIAYVFFRFRRALLCLAIFGVIFSVMLSGPLDLDNPINNYLSGDRVRIFSRHYGHSALMDIAILNLIITLSSINADRYWPRIFWICSSVIMIYLCRASIAYIGFITSFSIWLIERSHLGMRLKNIIYVFAVPAIIFLYIIAGDSIINEARILQVGSQGIQSNYGKDLTAGRNVLNDSLTRIIKDNELIGIGVQDKLLINGVIRNGQTVAATESSLRIAAKYGIFYYCIVALIGMSPFLVLTLKDTKIRIIGLGLGAYFLDVFLLDSLFEVPHEWNSLALMFPTLLVGEYARKGVENTGRRASA